MEELIQKLQSEHGLSAEQSHGILNTVVTFVKEKFPMIGGAIDNLFHTGAGPSAPVNPAGTQATTDSVVQDGGSFLDKISDFIPGETGEKIESFAKDKLGGMFGADKKA
jgi:hypothetical protein